MRKVKYGGRQLPTVVYVGQRAASNLKYADFSAYSGRLLEMYPAGMVLGRLVNSMVCSVGHPVQGRHAHLTERSHSHCLIATGFPPEHGT